MCLIIQHQPLLNSCRSSSSKISTAVKSENAVTVPFGKPQSGQKKKKVSLLATARAYHYMYRAVDVHDCRSA